MKKVLDTNTSMMAFPTDLLPETKGDTEAEDKQRQEAALAARLEEVNRKALEDKARLEAEQPVREKPRFEDPAPRIASADGILLALPSKHSLYDFKDVYATSLTGLHMPKLARARSERNSRLTAEVLGTTLFTSNETYNTPDLIYNLTVEDYYFILYWHLLNSFAEPFVTVRSYCTSIPHTEAVEKGEKPLASLSIVEKKRIDGLSLRYFEGLEKDYEALVGVPLKPCTVGDQLEWMEHPDFATDEEFRYAGRYACFLNTGGSIVDRIEVFKTLKLQQISNLKEYSVEVSKYGIDHKVTVTCTECGASRKDMILLDAHTFLSN